MAIKTFRPITPGLRHRVQVVNDALTIGNEPQKALTKGKKQNAGRASNGRISMRRKGGGHKRKYREIDWKRDKYGIPGKIATIEYDPNRSANIALVNYVDGEKRYIIAPIGLQVGQVVISGADAPIEIGNSLPLENIPVGFTIHNVELNLGKGAQMARSAGAGAMIVGSDGDYVTVKLPSNELRLVFKKCIATIGGVGNEDHMNERYGKAGRVRWLGKRPRVRGVAMNPVDHPHGGGGGRGKGYKTRDPHKPSSRFIVKRRK